MNSLETEILNLMQVEWDCKFSTREVANCLHHSPALIGYCLKFDAVSRTLHELAADGKIEKIKRGRYYYWKEKKNCETDRLEK